MALVEHRVDGNDGNLGCYYALATWRVHTYLDGVTWRGHNSSNCEEAILRIASNGLMHYDTLVWAGGGSRQMFDNAWAWSVGVQTVARGPKNMAKGGSSCSGNIGCCFCLCGGVDYWLDVWNADVRINSGTTQVGSSCQCLGNHSGDAIYNLPNNLRILPPTGLSVTFPSSIGNSLSASISKWSSNSNIGGVPTNLPNAKYWNWAVDLLDKNGNMLAHYADNRGSSKSVTLPTNAFYTASGLPSSSAAAGSRYYTKANMAYKLRVVVNNEFNQQQQAMSSTIYTKPPTPSVTITSCVYDPATKKCVLSFNWSKASDGGAYTETVKYDVYDAAGKYYVSGGTLKTVTGGAAASGSGVTVAGLASGEQIFVKVYVTATSGTSTTTKSTYSPVANAAFLGFDWDELRRTVTVRAEAPGAANCRIQAGDAPNKYNLGNQLTSGEVGTIVLKDLPHGDGQALYLQAVPEASNGYQYINEIAKVTVPVPNPILGVLTPPCGSETEQRYIVDIVEKKADCSVTPKWQVGDRVVVKDKCPPPRPCFLNVKCVEENNAPYNTDKRYAKGETGYRVYEVEWAPGWGKEDLTWDKSYEGGWAETLSVEWVDDTHIKWTFVGTNLGNNAVYTMGHLEDNSGNDCCHREITTYSSGSGGRLDIWNIYSKQNATFKRINITSVTP